MRSNAFDRSSRTWTTRTFAIGVATSRWSESAFSGSSSDCPSSARRGRRTRRNCGRHRHLARRERLSAEQQEIALWVSVAMWLEARNRPGIQRPAVIRPSPRVSGLPDSGFLPYISHSCGCDLVKAKGRCRVARSGRPLLALARSVLGDFHHTAPPSVRLVARRPRFGHGYWTRKRETLE